MGIEIEQWESEGLYHEYLGHKIFYRDNSELEKPCLICVHGFPTSSWDWRELWLELGRNFRVIALDMLGFGFSDKPSNHAYLITEQAQIVVSLIQSLGIKSYHVIAHDFGTLVAQELLFENEQTPNLPEMLSVFAMSGSIFPELSNPRLIQKLLVSPIGPIITKLFNEKKFYRSLRRVFGPDSAPNHKTLYSYWQLLAHKHGHKQLHCLNFFLKDRKSHGHRWAESWQRTDIPIRYIAGEADPMYGLDGIEMLRKISNKQDIHAIPNIGHFPHIESPSKVLSLVREFIG